MERKKVETKVGVFLVGRLEYWRSFCPKNSQPQKIKRKNLVAQEGRVWSSIVILDFVRRIKGRTDPIRERQRDFYFIISRLLYKKLFGRKRAKGLFGQFGILLFFLYSLLFFPFFFCLQLTMLSPLVRRAVQPANLAARSFHSSTAARLAMPVTNAPTSAYAKEKQSNGKYLVTLIPGDGIGPEVSHFMELSLVRRGSRRCRSDQSSSSSS